MATDTHKGDGPLPALLLALTFVTGLIDGVSFFRLDHVFVANMTGNVVFLGFAVADAREFSVAASSIALAGFLAGGLAGGRLGRALGSHRARILALGSAANVVIIGAVALALALVPSALDDARLRYVLVATLAFAMGLQNATARRLAVPDLTTTVLTQTLTSIAADSAWAGGRNPRPFMRMAAVAIMFAGAALGAVLVLRFNIAAAIGLAFVIVATVAGIAWRSWRSTAPWTVAAG
jgi:uncharacterized membrane protein YoaK (UPF0700 family)